MQYKDIINRLSALRYLVAEERVSPQQLKTWRMPYCAISVGAETTDGADLRPYWRKQPIMLTLYTSALDKAEQEKIKTMLDEMAISYTMDGEFIENGNMYATDFVFVVIQMIKRS